MIYNDTNIISYLLSEVIVVLALFIVPKESCILDQTKSYMYTRRMYFARTINSSQSLFFTQNDQFSSLVNFRVGFLLVLFLSSSHNQGQC